MPRIQQIVPAADWYATYLVSGGARGRAELSYRPLVAWALLPQASEWAAVEPDDQIVGLIVDDSGLVAPVDETDDAFQGYQRRP